MVTQRRDGDVVVAVQDAGVGVDPDSVDQLFRVEPEVDVVAAHLAVEQHGGRLWATANPRYGATFSFALPVLA
jgi:signal transduction histidine kinase